MAPERKRRMSKHKIQDTSEPEEIPSSAFHFKKRHIQCFTHEKMAPRPQEQDGKISQKRQASQLSLSTSTLNINPNYDNNEDVHMETDLCNNNAPEPETIKDVRAAEQIYHYPSLLDAYTLNNKNHVAIYDCGSVHVEIRPVDISYTEETAETYVGNDSKTPESTEEIESEKNMHMSPDYPNLNTEYEYEDENEMRAISSRNHAFTAECVNSITPSSVEKIKSGVEVEEYVIPDDVDPNLNNALTYEDEMPGISSRNHVISADCMNSTMPNSNEEIESESEDEYILSDYAIPKYSLNNVLNYADVVERILSKSHVEKNACINSTMSDSSKRIETDEQISKSISASTTKNSNPGIRNNMNNEPSFVEQLQQEIVPESYVVTDKSIHHSKVSMPIEEIESEEQLLQENPILKSTLDNEPNCDDVSGTNSEIGAKSTSSINSTTEPFEGVGAGEQILNPDLNNGPNYNDNNDRVRNISSFTTDLETDLWMDSIILEPFDEVESLEALQDLQSILDLNTDDYVLDLLPLMDVETDAWINSLMLQPIDEVERILLRGNQGLPSNFNNAPAPDDEVEGIIPITNIETAASINLGTAEQSTQRGEIIQGSEIVPASKQAMSTSALRMNNDDYSHEENLSTRPPGENGNDDEFVSLKMKINHYFKGQPFSLDETLSPEEAARYTFNHFYPLTRSDSRSL